MTTVNLELKNCASIRTVCQFYKTGFKKFRSVYLLKAHLRLVVDKDIQNVNCLP